jgi:hypothetical protein
VQSKKFATGGLTQNATAIWLNDIKSTLEAGPVFWSGTMDLSQELEILESYNAVKGIQLFGPAEAGYVLTSIGRHAASYVQQAGL